MVFYFMGQLSLLNPTLSDILREVEYRKSTKGKMYYAPFDREASNILRQYYVSCLDIFDLSLPFFYKDIKFSDSASRVVVGDYGAYMEFDKVDTSVMRPKFNSNKRPNIKYIWYVFTVYPDSKVYYQLRTVSYADYVVGKWYIDPKEIHQ